ncbi:transposase family protein [Kitasatospora sp. MMS16-BH015]|uniref:transposase family protein n=1 Tax=Kitasatospora sp. MMS16-BH015 TaxID=2018025 RepID=UPI00210F9429|nr:transposase family protein [Kitasatospora sp. MMS16-BH015]
MPACASSPISPALDQLRGAPLLPCEAPRLLERLTEVPDPRDPRGVSHPLAVVLALAACAVLVGAASQVGVRPDPILPARQRPSAANCDGSATRAGDSLKERSRSRAHPASRSFATDTAEHASRLRPWTIESVALTG